MSRKTFVAVVVHILCWVAEFVLWHMPFKMPIPLFVGLVAFLGAFSFVLICMDIIAWWRWSKIPFQDPAALAAQLAAEDGRRLEQEMQLCFRKENAA